jgi:hypothetical protein
MTSAAVRSRPYLDTVPDWELKYVHMLASSVHTYTSPMQAHARMLGYDCYEYVIDQVLDASCDGSPCLVLFCIALVFSWIFSYTRGAHGAY